MSYFTELVWKKGDVVGLLYANGILALENLGISGEL